MTEQARELRPEQLRRSVDPVQFSFASTAELAALQEMIGQDRAKRSLHFGMEMDGHGFNIFALGQVGTGRTTMVRRLAEQKAAGEPAPQDWVYVYNFQNPNNPRAMSLPAGRGCALRHDMDELAGNLRRELTRAFESEEYERQKARIGQQLQEAQSRIFSELQKQAESRGFGLARTPAGVMVVPTSKKGEALSEADYERLPPQAKEQIEASESAIQQEIAATMHKARQSQKEAQDSLQNLDRQVAAFATGHFIDELVARYSDLPQVVEYLEQVRKDVVEHVDLFRSEPEQAGPMAQLLGASQEAAMNRYKVNQIVDNCDRKSAPVIFETNPTYYNLIGEVQQEAQFGALVTDFTKIRGGAFHRANGGYLILEARNVLLNPFAWDALKRVLKDGRIEIEEMGQQWRVFNTTTLEPQPIPADVKVILIGEPYIYYLLYEYDEDFKCLFKVQADFGGQVDRDDATIQQYALFVAQTVRDHNLRHFDPTGVARIIEHGSRVAEDQKKLATRFSEIADLIDESSYWAAQAGHELVSAADVGRAIEEKKYRANRIEERIREMIERGVIMVDTEGAVVGQVNGLSVSMLGDYEFGRPSRITARTYLGRGNVVAIDRDVELAGPIHNKGVLILAGYLGGRFAQDMPLSLSASITFEQSYEGVEGDSASSAELYALLSSLADVPLKQNLAVTGSVNQRGEVQAIGGVNAKIEGFFDVARVKGLTGDQGVLIPAANIDNLMLRDDVLQAVQEGRFHIYAVRTIDEGLEVLTGLPAGQTVDGEYPEGTINRRVKDRLRQLAELYRAFSEAMGEEEEEQPERKERQPEAVRGDASADAHGQEGKGADRAARVRSNAVQTRRIVH
ncbi:MAG: Lon protease family protein [Anaerolineae bacterium]